MVPCDLVDEEIEFVEPGSDEFQFTRRQFLQASGAAAMATALPGAAEKTTAAAQPVMTPLSISINGQNHDLQIDTRTSLLDLLREHLDMTGSKKGCDHGQCGACTVLVDGRRVNSCLTLAVAAAGANVVTVEGLGDENKLGPAQQAFLDHDGFQCGYCTPGQICSATALVDELKAGERSLVSFEERTGAKASDRELKERMSGNICRCGAYPNIVAAVRALTGGVA